jgi:hypothetical protein
MSSRIPVRVLIPSLACAAALCLAVSPAEAKAGLTVSAVPVTSHGHPTGQVAVTVAGGDDAAGLQRLCVQESAGAAWRTLVCGRIEFGNAGPVRAVAVRSTTRTDYFRGELWREVRRQNPRGGTQTVQVLDLLSAPLAVAPFRQPHTNLRSAVSLSSVDKGIVWASVVRLK